MSKENLTLENTVYQIQSALHKYNRGKNGKHILIDFLEQIRGEILSEWVNSRDKDFDDIIDEVFNKYLTEKGGK